MSSTRPRRSSCRTRVPHFNGGLLYLESQLRRNLPNDDRIRLGHRAVMDLVPYQLDPALQALQQPRSRILIADAVGLGKTLEAGILATELIQRGRGKRILVVTLKSMLTQFQKEFWSRFSIPLVRLDSVGLARVRNRIPANHNPFNYFDRAIISIDTLKNNLEYRNYLEKAWWDVIVIDECHNVAARAGERAVAPRAAGAAARPRSDTLVPALGHAARRLGAELRVSDEPARPDRHQRPGGLHAGRLSATRASSSAGSRRTSATRSSADSRSARRPCCARQRRPRRRRHTRRCSSSRSRRRASTGSGQPHELQRVGLQKALFSSPLAAADSTATRIDAAGRARHADRSDERAEVAALKPSRTASSAIDAGSFSQVPAPAHAAARTRVRLVTAPRRDDRLVIFSERLDTLRWLKRCNCRAASG